MFDQNIMPLLSNLIIFPDSIFGQTAAYFSGDTIQLGLRKVEVAIKKVNWAGQPFQLQQFHQHIIIFSLQYQYKISCVVARIIIRVIIIWLTDFVCCDWSIPGP